MIKTKLSASQIIDSHTFLDIEELTGRRGFNGGGHASIRSALWHDQKVFIKFSIRDQTSIAAEISNLIELSKFSWSPRFIGITDGGPSNAIHGIVMEYVQGSVFRGELSGRWFPPGFFPTEMQAHEIEVMGKRLKDQGFHSVADLQVVLTKDSVKLIDLEGLSKVPVRPNTTYRDVEVATRDLAQQLRDWIAKHPAPN